MKDLIFTPFQNPSENSGKLCNCISCGKIMQQEQTLFRANNNVFYVMYHPITHNHLRNEFCFSDVHGAMNCSGSRAK